MGKSRRARTRYFMCTFSGMDTSEDAMDLRTGKVCCRTTDGRFISEKFVINLITHDFQLDGVFVMQVVEMTEEDYDDFSEGMDDKDIIDDATSFL